MNLNAIGSEIAAVVGVIDPDAYAASTVTTGWVKASDFQQLMAIIQAGTLGASATLDAKIEQASDSGGTGAKDLTGSDITQLTQAGTDDSDKQAVINFRADDLDIQNGFEYVRVSMTIGIATSDAGAVLFGMNARTGVASDSDASSVAEIVTV